MNLLIIDDDYLSNLVHTRIARNTGLFKEIRVVPSGKAALEIFNQISEDARTFPDVIFLDLDKPVMDGFDFILALEKLNFPKKEQLSIVILTSSDKHEDLARAREMGIKHYLQKSFLLKDLQTTLFSINNMDLEKSATL